MVAELQPRGHFDQRVTTVPLWRRLSNHLRATLRSRHLACVYSPLYQVDLGGAPVDTLRGARILSYLLTEKMLRAAQLHRPRQASLRDLRGAHSRTYLEALRRPEALNPIVGFEVWPELHRQALVAQRAAVGGTLLATRLALEGGRTVINLGGGFHHAGRSEGRGFCIFNDVAVAISRTRCDGFGGPVLVIDLDLHDGNGTREIFAEDQTVFTFSIHNQTWDTSPALASLSIELEGEIDDSTYLNCLAEHLPRLITQVRPELIYFLAGTDPAADDRLGNWRLSPQGMLARDRYVMERIAAAAGSPPTVILLAGGYGGETWRHSGRFFAWILTGQSWVDPPSSEQMTLSRYRHLFKELGGADFGAASGIDDWGLTEADILGGLGREARRRLFLDHYSQHAVELALEWTGLFDRLRRGGFVHPTLQLDLDSPSGHTIRIFGDSDAGELLVELRLRIDRTSVRGAQLLCLEWLLLQNPRASFPASRGPMPGQKHPGLNLTVDIISLLILICDQLQLDGILMVPSHYHLVLAAKTFFRFLHPEDEGWFRAVHRLLRPVSLGEATRLVADGALIDCSTGEALAWRPMQMVLPTSDRLRDLVETKDFQRQAAVAETRYSIALEGDRVTDDRQNRAAPE